MFLRGDPYPYPLPINSDATPILLYHGPRIGLHSRRLNCKKDLRLRMSRYQYCKMWCRFIRTRVPILDYYFFIKSYSVFHLLCFVFLFLFKFRCLVRHCSLMKPIHSKHKLKNIYSYHMTIFKKNVICAYVMFCNKLDI